MDRLPDMARRILTWVRGEGRADTLVNLALVAGLLLAIGSVGWAVAVPDDGDSFTELSLLTENESGAIVADDYPTTVTRGEAMPLVVEIGNNEHRPMNYTVVVELQRVAPNDTTTVRTEFELRRFALSVGTNETHRKHLSPASPLTGSRLRLAFLLYKGSVPADPTIETADREVHLWLNVVPPR